VGELLGVGVGTERQHERALGAAHSAVDAEHDGLVGRVAGSFEAEEAIDDHGLERTARATRAAHQIAAGLLERTVVAVGLEHGDGLADGVGRVGHHCS